MSVSVFPSLPGTQVSFEREVISGSTSVFQTVSRQEQRVSWQGGAIYRYRMAVKVRANVAAPLPWGAYSERAIVERFHFDHRGSWDSFLFDDPVDGVQRRVRFEDDGLRLRRILGTWYEFELALVTTHLDAGGPGVSPSPPLDALALYD